MGNFGFSTPLVSFATGDEDFVDGAQPKKKKKKPTPQEVVDPESMSSGVGRMDPSAASPGGVPEMNEILQALMASGELPMLARGTDYFEGGDAIVGEEGPELVNLPEGSQVIPQEDPRYSAWKQRRPADMLYREQPMDLDGLTGHDGGAGYSADLPGYDPTGIEDEEREIQQAAAGDEKPNGWMERIADSFGNSPMQSSGEGMGGLAAGLLTLLVNHKVGAAGKQLKTRRDAAAGERKYAQDQRAKDEDSRRQLQRQVAVERYRKSMESKPPQLNRTINVGGYDVSVDSELGKKVIAGKAGITLKEPKAAPKPGKPSSSVSTGMLNRAEERLKSAKDGFRRRYWAGIYKSPEEFASFGSSPLPPEAEAGLEKDPEYQRAKDDYDGAYVVNVLRSAATVDDVEEAKAYLMGLAPDKRKRLLMDPSVLRAEKAAEARIAQGE